MMQQRSIALATPGPAFGFDTLGARVGAVATIGVGGAPGDDKNEARAAVGLTRIADRLPR